MKKYISIFLFLVAFPAFAATSLWEYAKEHNVPTISFSERARMAIGIGIKNYKGTKEQNAVLLDSLQKKTIPVLGASFATPTTATGFEDSLAFGISSSATTFTLTTGKDKSKVLLASSTYGFTLDVNTSKEEDILADCTGTACINAVRGLSDLTGTSSVTALQFAHARGAKVTITTAPITIFLTNVLLGKQYMENKLKYQTTVSCSAADTNNTICEKAYIDGVAVAGAANANTTTKGIVQEATAIQAASTTVTGSTLARLYLPAGIATSSPSANAGVQVVMSEGTAKLNEKWFGRIKTCCLLRKMSYVSQTALLGNRSNDKNKKPRICCWVLLKLIV